MLDNLKDPSSDFEINLVVSLLPEGRDMGALSVIRRLMGPTRNIQHKNIQSILSIQKTFET